MEPMLSYQNWVFCKHHGLEYCHRCFCDYRTLNDNWIEEAMVALSQDDQEELSEFLSDRNPLNVYSLGTLVHFSEKKDSTLKCFEHSALDCPSCFDFTRLTIESFGFTLPRPSPPRHQNQTLGSNDASGAVYGLMREVGQGRYGRNPPSAMPAHIRRPLLFHPSSPHRFLPPSTTTKPMDLFKDQEDRSLNRFHRYFHNQDDTAILAFTDGACLDGGNASRRRAGWSFVFNDDHEGCADPLEGTIGGPEQTSNRAELRAVIGFLQMRVWESGGADKFVIATDSEYVVNGVCDRLEKWIRKGWRTSSGSKVANKDMWEALKREMDNADLVGIRVLFWKIPREWNTRADKLAKAAADRSDRSMEAYPVIGMMF